MRGHKRWEDIVTEFEEYLFGLGKAQNSISTYGTAIRNFGQYYRDELKKTGLYPSKLMETDLQTFVDYLRIIQYFISRQLPSTRKSPL